MYRPSYLLGEVVDELPIDEHVDSVIDDLSALFTHLILLRLLDLSHLVFFSFFDSKNRLFVIVCAISSGMLYPSISLSD